jgi:hypothetical protein
VCRKKPSTIYISIEKHDKRQRTGNRESAKEDARIMDYHDVSQKQSDDAFSASVLVRTIGQIFHRWASSSPKSLFVSRISGCKSVHDGGNDHGMNSTA